MKYSDKQVEVKKTVEQDKPFPGRNTGQMPLLLEEGRSPWTAARFMKERIDHADEFPDLRGYLDVVPLVAYDSKGRSTDIKVVLAVDKNRRATEKGRKALELINRNTDLTSDYAIPLSNELYDSLPGIVVPRADLGILERDLTEAEFLANKVWRIVLGNPNEVPAEFAEDANLMKESYRWVKSQTKQEQNMWVYLDGNSDVAKLRAFYVSRLVDMSRLDGRFYLNGDGGRLVGYLAPEAPNASVAEERVVRPYTEADVNPAREQLAELEKFVRPESLDKVKSLVERL